MSKEFHILSFKTVRRRSFVYEGFYKNYHLSFVYLSNNQILVKRFSSDHFINKHLMQRVVIHQNEYLILYNNNMYVVDKKEYKNLIKTEDLDTLKSILRLQNDF